MDTPTITEYYRETDPMKRRALLDQAIAEGEDAQVNEVRKEIWEARYSAPTNDGGVADGFLRFWMTMEFNRSSGHKIFGAKGAVKDIRKELESVNFQQIRAKSPLHEELLYRECEHLIKFYMDLCGTDKSYNTMLCGLIPIKKDDVKAKLQRDIYETAVCLPKDLSMEDELSLITKAAHAMYEVQFPGEGGMPE